VSDLELGPEQLGRTDRHDLGAGLGTRLQIEPVALDAVDLDARPFEDHGLGADIDPFAARGIVEQCTVGGASRSPCRLTSAS